MRSFHLTATHAAALSFLLVGAGAVYSSLKTLRESAVERARAAAAARAAIGKQIFFDTTLSEPAGTSCASCHDPERGFAGNHGSDNGVARGSRPDHFAKRNTPSVMYLGFVH